MKRFTVFNNQIIPAQNAKVPITDLGVIRGYGVFDVAIAFFDHIHRINDHLKRFFYSAKTLGLKPPYGLNTIADLTQRLVKKNNYSYSSVKWILTGGESADGKTVTTPSFFILNEPAKDFPLAYYTKGVKIITADHMKEFPNIKSTNYQFAYLSYPHMKKVGAFELIYAPRGQILEGLTSNIFIVKDNIVITPKKDILSGITRQEVIELSLLNGLAIVQRSIKLQELYSADEVFITASLKKIMPVVRVDNKTISTGKPGIITKELIRLHRSGLIAIRDQQCD